MNPLSEYEIPGRVTAVTGRGGLPALRIISDSSEAEIYLHGAHVSHFKKKGEAPLLFMSSSSEFDESKPLRGGIPVIFPWFGPRDTMPMHGFARIRQWRLTDTSVAGDGSVHLTFQLPGLQDFEVEYTVTVGALLALELTVTNTNTDKEVSFETCLHTYFHTGPIGDVSIVGLNDCNYFDKVLGGESTEAGDSIRITGETDRVYQGTTATVEIRDPGLGRTIHVRKSGSNSTVVWNPWVDKSKAMPDFGAEEYQQMLCVESANVGTHRITLGPGQKTSLKVEMESVALA